MVDHEIERLRRASDIYLAGSFLHLLCHPDHLNIGLALLVSGASEASKQAVIAELAEIGAIEHIEGVWQVTPKGRDISQKLSRSIEARF